ncbi:sensor domain-containing diguanylate cyclase [Hydrogenimonas thermophila]|uniref:diguanylate cyclase n=1 Tax=Hydrogenimonas thermophila TaxID=223786 RepID=A0A1I5R6J1_9BACT|nr:diguanylate cyclase [Hydrogenimonas thermophila]WOE70690.1 diguanylate cyclase [Hydrogenimonas thermophila]WOE73208.1 diguanylate cyclase [Hydrogenimonas thermophila]SFP53967.1 diguanylate cyclase (GGDEF) domain-containing protein [Hydrogenimonas thermophila]
MKKLHWFILIGSIVAILTSIGYVLFNYLNKEVSVREEKFYSNEAETIRNSVIAMIEEKEKSTLAIAVTMQNNYVLIDSFKSGIVPEERFKYIIKMLNEKTLYKNVWFQLIDKNGKSLYRSWTSNNYHITNREDIKLLLKKPEVQSGINVSAFTIYFKALVPIYDKDRQFLGIFEVITHFNSIARQFHKKGTHSIILADKRFKNILKYPYTNKFIDDYYVANFNADSYWIDYIKRNGVENYINITSYRIETDQMILTVPIKNSNETIGYYILIKPISNIKDASLSFFIFKFITLAGSLSAILMIIIIVLLWRRSEQRKYYYKHIIDASSNIILVLNKNNNLIDINRKFFDYFSDYKSLEEFKAEYKCIGDFFVKEDGLLQKFMDGKHWLEFLIEHPTKEYKAKIVYKDKEWYFKVHANSIFKSKNTHYVVILNDVTTLEKQRKKLEKASLTDPLTGIGNRRYFNIKLDNEIIRSKRYSVPLSIIMFDIDHFKKVNDEFGHDVGDSVLKELARIIKKNLRQIDIFCRVGGEEFMIILPETEEKNAYQISEKLRKIVESHSKESIPKVTISLGIAQFFKNDDKDNLLKRVDNALYKAKENGRNQSCIAK